MVTTSSEIHTDNGRDLVVLSHLRWNWVWQRPQHLVSRFAAERAIEGGRTVFVEEPLADDVESPTLMSEVVGSVTRLWLVVPRLAGEPELLSFDAKGAEQYAAALAAFFGEEGIGPAPDVLVYTPMALEIAQALSPSRLAYDVMDDLASFLNAPEGLRLKQRRLFAAADVLFAGGRSLHQGVVSATDKPCHLFASGVDVEHYERSRSLRRDRVSARPVAGYVGVLDERLDLGLIADLAAELSDWTIRMVGPLAKISASSLPTAPNIEYPGMASYEELPAVMADFDVAIMPFALNEATRSISPTKTLEFLAAGLPIVSTRVPDVVADYTGLVSLASTPAEFAALCLSAASAVEHDDDGIASRLRENDWNSIAARMHELLRAAPPRRSSATDQPGDLAIELEGAHARASFAASAGLSDAALGSDRLTGAAVATLAEAAVSSATPFLRAPLLARLSAAQLLHPAAGDVDGMCATCGTPAPCETAKAVQW